MTEQELTQIAADSRTAVSHRDWAIRQARRDGMTLRQIAKAVGMSAAGVKRIIDVGEVAA